MRGLGSGGRLMRAVLWRLCGLWALLGTSSSWALMAEDPGGAVDHIFAEWTDPDSPGAAVAVVQNDEIVLSRGYGLANLEYRVVVTPDTPFDIGSVTKQFTAFAVAMLAAEGKLSLDDDVRKFIPEMRATGSIIRIEHLLNHTSGLRDEFNLLTMEGYGVEDAITFEHSLRLITNQEELLFEPGEKWEYSNSGYTLLAEVISRVTQTPYRVWIKANVFTPLGMTRTSFPEDVGTIIEGRARSYTATASGFRAAAVNKSSLGCSNLFSTANDMARWAVNFNNVRVGGQSIISRMGERGILNDGTLTDYAFGQFLGEYRGAHTFSHGGGVGGYRSAFIRFPEQKLAVIVLANADYFNAMALAKQVAEIFIGDVLHAAPPGVENGSANEAASRKSVELKDCIGSYRLESTGKVLEVVMQDTVLALKNLATEGKALPLAQLDSGQFMIEGMGLRLSFVVDDDGAVNRLILHVGNPPQTAVRTSIIEMSEHELRKFVGTYLSRELLVVYSLEFKDGALVAHHSRLPPTKLAPTAAGEFGSEKAWLRTLRFERDKAGNPVGFRADAAYAKNVYFERLK